MHLNCHFWNVHLRLLFDGLDRPTVLVFGDPVLWVSLWKDAHLRKAESYFPGIYLPGDDFVNEVEKGLFVDLRVIGFWLNILHDILHDPIIVLQVQLLTQGTPAALEVELMGLLAAAQLSDGHYLFIYCNQYKLVQLLMIMALNTIIEITLSAIIVWRCWWIDRLMVIMG